MANPAAARPAQISMAGRKPMLLTSKPPTSGPAAIPTCTQVL
jgi:hypothetical protein